MSFVPTNTIAALLAIACLVSPIAAQESQETFPLRIVTFNAEILTEPGVNAGSISKYRFPHAREQHFERIAAVIETLNPDVLNLVEVTHKGAVDRLIEILHEKGLTEYRGYHVENNDRYTGLDVALITKFQPDEIDGKQLQTIYSPQDDPTWRQSFQFKGREGTTIQRNTGISRNGLYFITIGGHKLAFFGLHLKSNPSDAYSNGKRQAQAEIARRVLRSKVLPNGYLPIVLGDLNDYDPDIPDGDTTRDPTTTVLRDLKDFDKDQAGDELVNVAKLIQRQADRFTSHWDWNENGAHDGDDVYTMIDHILLAKELMPYVKRVFICHAIGLDTTDHFPVVVDLQLPKLDAVGNQKVAQRNE